MIGPRSLRSRVLFGSILWTAGLLALAHMLFLAVNKHFPEMHLTMHFSGLPVFFILSMLGVAAVGLLLLLSGVLPFKRLRARLNAVRDGEGQRVDGMYPTEVQPLVNDLNALLDHREQTVRRALAKAGDLAHGLKTPLAVLTQEADRAEAAGQHEVAAAISQQVERMRRQIDYHLAHARAAGSGAAPGARCPVATSAQGLARTLLQLNAGRRLAIDVDVPAEHCVRGQREDLDEMLGNLLDNACKWAKSRVTVHSTKVDATIVITVDDDGPGLAPEMREAVLQRGVRADEVAPGSGLGLAIVLDLAELYGGSISLTDSPAQGLRAELRLPAC